MSRKSLFLAACLAVALVLTMAPAPGIAAPEGAMTATPVRQVLIGEQGSSPPIPPDALQQLGRMIFFDENLSTPWGQSCAACHAPEVGFTGPVGPINAVGAVYPGAVHSRFGNRKPPASAYVGASPKLHYDAVEGVWVGGMFWDGRATGDRLGDPLAEQAQGPFLNPLEQNNPNPKAVCDRIARSHYADFFEQVWGSGSLNCLTDVTGTYERIARSIAAYERSMMVDPFSSKYDLYLRGQVKLSKEEARGLRLFEGKAKCSLCHVSQPGPDGRPPLFTDFTYDNLGLPKNPANPFYFMPPSTNPDGIAWIDTGLGGFLKAAGYGPGVYEPEMGKFKVPTLRNVDRRPYPEFVKAFGHNGAFKSLEAIVHFYNTRDVLAPCGDVAFPRMGENCWPQAEYPLNVNTDELGDLGLSPDEEAAVVLFMKTLSDGYVPVP